jgi:tetratricopeptide (TPR) repeat protein
MSKQKNKPVPTGKIPAQQKQPHGKPVPKAVQPSGDSFIKRNINLLLPIALAVVTWLFYRACLDNQLTNWDDPGYIKDNALIKDISSEGLNNIFTTSTMGNYHPLTILSYAIEYSFVRLDPWLYHLDSLLLHIAVTILVYWFVLLLAKRPVAAAITALLFGLHPMHVESVAWLAGRKDVVYGVFYMAACITYILYLRAGGTKKWLWYAGTVVLYLCSLLGKPVAVVLPVTLLLIDYFEKRKLHVWMFADKLLLLGMSVYFGLKSLDDQEKFLALDTLDVNFSKLERLALGGYALITYLWKAIVPVGLANFYPYPMKAPGSSLSAVYYLYSLGAVALIVFLVLMFRQKKYVVVFGSMFFLVNIALLLQFIPVGGAILADRYTYIPYLGLFFMAGWGISVFFEQGGNRNLGNMALTGILAYSMILGYLTNERCKVWYDTTSLWRDLIEKEPVRAPNAWNNLGFNYFNKYNESVDPQERRVYYDSAYFLLKRAIELQPTFVNPYISIGELLRSEGKFPEAKAYYYKALSMEKTAESSNAYLGLAIIYAISHNFDSSGTCFKLALETRPYFPEAHSNFGNFYDMTGKPDSALVEYGIALQQNPDMYAPHLNRGRLLTRMNRIDEALQDFEMALQLNPGNGEVYYARSFCYQKKGNSVQALKDIMEARRLGFTQIDPNYYRAVGGR